MMDDVEASNKYPPWHIQFYTKTNGEQPVIAFLEAQPLSMQAKIFRTIELLQRNGNRLPEPYSKKITKNIFELRIKVSTDISRVFYFFTIGSQIVLTNGFVKKTQKTPPREIEKAEQYRKDFLIRQ